MNRTAFLRFYKDGLYFVGVEVGEKGVAAFFKTFHLLAHEFAREIVDGFGGGKVGGNLEVQLVGSLGDEVAAPVNETDGDVGQVLAVRIES